MATYFNIIIPIKKLLADLEQILITHSINVYVEKFNEAKGFYYEQIAINYSNLAFVQDKDYRGFFFTSLHLSIKKGQLSFDNKKTKQDDDVSFYDDELFNYCIEGKGGREDSEFIESIKLRIISKTPDKQIDKFYKALQALFKKSTDINKGLHLGQHFDNKLYYFKTNKHMLNDFANNELKYVE